MIDKSMLTNKIFEQKKNHHLMSKETAFLTVEFTDREHYSWKKNIFTLES